MMAAPQRARWLPPALAAPARRRPEGAESSGSDGRAVPQVRLYRRAVAHTLALWLHPNVWRGTASQSVAIAARHREPTTGPDMPDDGRPDRRQMAATERGPEPTGSPACAADRGRSEIDTTQRLTAAVAPAVAAAGTPLNAAPIERPQADQSAASPGSPSRGSSR